MGKKSLKPENDCFDPEVYSPNDPELIKIKSILPLREDVDIYYGSERDFKLSHQYADKLITSKKIEESQRNAIIYGLAVAASYLRFGEKMQPIGRDPDNALLKQQKLLSEELDLSGLKMPPKNRAEDIAYTGAIWIMALIWVNYLGEYFGDTPASDADTPFMRFCNDFARKIFPRFNPSRNKYRTVRDKMAERGLVKKKESMGRF